VVAEAGTLADRIDKLFKTIRRPNGREHSNEEVARACGFSKQYMGQLRRGESTNPTYQNLAALAAFFDVDVAYFFNSERAERIRADLELAAAIRDANVSALALRAASLSPADREKVLAFMRSLVAGSDETESSTGGADDEDAG
jgi:transcriptional regulator with XRE-family HTH domain